MKGHLQVDVDAEPHFYKPRNVPYVLREKEDQELTRLQEEGIIEPVKFADWAVPIVPVLKGNGESVRICRDFKLTVNQASIVDTYPIPQIEDLYASLAGQSPRSRHMTITTSGGLFQYY